MLKGGGVYSKREGLIQGAEDTSHNHNKGGRSWEGGVDSGSRRNVPWGIVRDLPRGRFWGAHNLCIPGYILGWGILQDFCRPDIAQSVRLWLKVPKRLESVFEFPSFDVYCVHIK